MRKGWAVWYSESSNLMLVLKASKEVGLRM